MHPKLISIQDYTYALPDNRIASSPLAERDASKLLVYKNGNIKAGHYRDIAAFIPADSVLVFNNTRVIQARILFQKPSGGVIEIFCLEPWELISEYSSAMAKKESLRWKCMIGGASKWKQGRLIKQAIINNTPVMMYAQLVDKLPDAYVVELSWTPADLSFAEVIDTMGDTPLPPYIKRKAADADKERYQTIYARHDGSVAAPTAGLHFTPAIFAQLGVKGVTSSYVTLHVGAGTFKPVKAAAMEQHEMHAEWIDVHIDTIQTLIDKQPQGIIAVGTTSVRTLESLYWMGVKTILSPEIQLEDLPIQQWDVYEAPLVGTAVLTGDALSALCDWMQRNNFQTLFTQTRILIAPGYQFRIPIAIITNFHQPQSTLLLLVAAAIGDHWKSVYTYAMENDFRFLSYGDGSLLFIDQ